jgi:endonuclease/exonuclease/phosphatase family metal-dependent hydrolase
VSTSRPSPARAIPPKQSDRVLIATWNIANLGVQGWRDKDYRLITEILNWFDLVALQEVNDNLAGVRAVRQHLGADYRLLFSDASGNDERMTFVDDATKLALLEQVGEVARHPATTATSRCPASSSASTALTATPTWPPSAPTRSRFAGERPPVLRLRQRDRAEPAKLRTPL